MNQLPSAGIHIYQKDIKTTMTMMVKETSHMELAKKEELNILNTN